MIRFAWLALPAVLVLCPVAPPAAAAPAAAVAPADSALTADLQAILETFLAENPIAPGVCAHVDCPALGVSWSGAAGTMARDTDEPLPADCTFRIASNTKTYVATAVLHLAEEGRLGLDDPLARHLPEDERALLASDGYDLDAITLRQVLSHTAGLCEHSGDPRYPEAILADPQHAWTREEQIRRAVEWCDPIGAPGERYKYSDTGYVILGGIVERVTGLPLGPAVRQLLDFDRLGQAATWWEYEEEPPPAAGPRAHQYFGDYDTTDWNASFDLFGGGGLVADTADMARFMRELLRGEVLHETATLDEMTSGGTPPYRLGLMAMELGGQSVLGHQGFWNTFAFHVPELDVTVAGSILNHDATNGRVLADRLVARVAQSLEARSGRKEG